MRSLDGVALRSGVTLSEVAEEGEEEGSVMAGCVGQVEEEWRKVHRGHPTLWWLIRWPL